MAIDLGVTIKQLIDEINSLSVDTSKFVTTDTEQTITGKKTFNDETVFNDIVQFKNGSPNIGSNGIRWDTASLPQDYNIDYVCTIDGFANGGRQKWASFNNLKSKLNIPTKVSQLTNDSGFTTNKGTVTQVKVNGTTKSPDSTGLVDLGTISGGGGSSYTFVEDASKTYIKYKGTEFGTNGDGFDLLGSAIVDWGDGTVDNYDDTSLYPTHTYTDGNTYHLISISGDIYWAHHPFYGNSYIEELTIPNTVNNDYTTTFGELDSVCYDCENLKIVKMQATTPPQIDEYCFANCPSLEKIIVPKSAWSAYKKATNWSNFANKIVYLTDSSDIVNRTENVIFDISNISHKDIYNATENLTYRYANINIRILNNATLQVGDKIQICYPKRRNKYNLDSQGNKIKMRFDVQGYKMIDEMVLTAEDISKYESGNNIITFIVFLCSYEQTLIEYEKTYHYIGKTYTDNVIKQKPLIVRIVRPLQRNAPPPEDFWNKPISNRVQVASRYQDANYRRLSQL